MVAMPAMADCPIADDLSDGIQFTLAGGKETDVYRHGSRGVIEMYTTYADGLTERTLLGEGVYMLEVVNTNDGQPDPASRVTFDFQQPPQAMANPKPHMRIKLDLETRVGTDAPTTQETLTVQWGAISEVTYGSCIYRRIPGTFQYEHSGNSAILYRYFLPDLGISVPFKIENGVNLFAIESISALGQK